MSTELLAPIQKDAAYPLPIFQKFTGLSTWAMRAARRKGLRVILVGNRRYIRGEDWLAYLAGCDEGRGQ